MHRLDVGADTPAVALHRADKRVVKPCRFQNLSGMSQMFLGIFLIIDIVQQAYETPSILSSSPYFRAKRRITASTERA